MTLRFATNSDARFSSVVSVDWDHVTGKPPIISGGDGETFVVNGTLAVNPTPATINKGIQITQTSPVGGSVAGPINFNTIDVTDQGFTVTGSGGDNFGLGNINTMGLRVNYTVTGGQLRGAMSGALRAVGTNPSASYYGVGGSVYSNVSVASMWGNLGIAQIGPTGSTSILVGMEGEVAIATGGTALYRVGVGSNSQGPVAGSTLDTAFLVTCGPNLGSAPFKKMFSLSSQIYGAQAPLATTADIFYADAAITVANVFNSANWTVTGKFADFTTFGINGATGQAAFGVPLSMADAKLTVSNNTVATAAPTNTPALHLVGANGAFTGTLTDAFGIAAQAIISARLAFGTAAAPTSVTGPATPLTIGASSLDSSGAYGSNAALDFTASGAAGGPQTNTDHGGYIRARVTSPGTTSPREVWRVIDGFMIGSGLTDPGFGNLNLGGGSLLNNGTAPTGTGAYVRAVAPVIGLVNATGLPISTGVTGLGTGVATFLATPSSANLAAALTDEDGTGLVPFEATGTWTPTDQSGAALTFTAVNCRYTKIGNIIHAYGTFTFPSTASGATILIGGLPFTVPNQTYAAIPGPIRINSIGGSTADILAMPVVNTVNFNMFSNGTGLNIVNSVATLGVFAVNITYPFA